jgi:formamidopyrimidine-DNA glycosylase
MRKGLSSYELIPRTMPELPEVELARRYLEDQVLGRKISGLKVLDQGILEGIDGKGLRDILVGRRFVAARRHGKQLFLELEGEGCLTMHFGMTGEATFSERGRVPGKHDRLVLDFGGEEYLVFNDQRKFGAISYSGREEEFIERKHLGPDALSVSRQDFVERVGAHHQAVKTTLMDQHVVAGIGNLYSDEILYQTRVHPTALSSALGRRKLGKMHETAWAVLRASIQVRTDFSQLPEGYMLRDRWAGAPCPRRNGRLEHMVVGGRTALFCPSCQPSP